MPKTLLWLVAAIVLAMMIAAGLRAYGTALVGSGYSAEILCGAVFVSGREPAAVEAEDLSGPGLELAPYFDKQVERDAKRVAGSFHGLAAQIAIFRDGSAAVPRLMRVQPNPSRKIAICAARPWKDPATRLASRSTCLSK